MIDPLIYGLVTGLEIALLALAFQVAYLPTRVFFIGLAGIYALAPYVFNGLMQICHNPWLAFTGATVICVLLSVAFDLFNHGPLTRQGNATDAHFLSSLGLYVVIVQVIAMTCGSGPQGLSGMSAHDPVRFGDFILSWPYLMIAATSVPALLVIWLVLTRSQLGIGLRAFASNPAQMSLYGHHMHLYRVAAFALSGALAALAALLRAYDVGFDPYGGLAALMLAVVAVIVGGRGSFSGPVLGALLLGIVRTTVSWFFEARWQDAASFMLLCLVLLIRPRGIVGEKYRVEIV